jgi:hypothetical protein
LLIDVSFALERCFSRAGLATLPRTTREQIDYSRLWQREEWDYSTLGLPATIQWSEVSRSVKSRHSDRRADVRFTPKASINYVSAVGSVS